MKYVAEFIVLVAAFVAADLITDAIRKRRK